MRTLAAVAVVLMVSLAAPSFGQNAGEPDIRYFFEASSDDKGISEDALDALAANWKNGYAAMLLEWVRFLPSGRGPATGGAFSVGAESAPTSSVNAERDMNTSVGEIDRGPSRFRNRRDPRIQTRERIVKFLESQTGQKFGDDLERWRHWVWAQPYEPHSMIGPFKANVYANVDARFRNFFQGDSLIRIDEIDWGGVQVGGIPALDHAPTVSAAQASYLDDSNIVFGFYADGAARAYPKRILAWHELAWDKVGETDVTLVYCTLCGTVIPYKSRVGGRLVKFDTSGLLYRSNKLLYDELTWTLWSSLTGEAVAGRMVGRGVRLEPMPVVTTTWGEWKAMHPDTTVLSPDTGHERDYSEGAAYAEYFATDELMFEVAHKSDRLDNKDEVLALRAPRADGSGDDALAIAAAFLTRNRVYQTSFAGRDVVVVTSGAGANRVYEAGEHQFTGVDGDVVVDAQGNRWTAGEEGLVPEGNPGGALARVPAFRAFWFGWYAQYPDTELIAD